MSHRRPDPRQAMLEQTLRRALRMAADTIEPASDGLDRIRSKIAAGPPAPLQPAGWTGWRTRLLTDLLAALSPAARYLEPAWIRIRYAYGAVVDRFRPDQGAAGWVGWLRPAAALATALLVVTGASWAIATLPQQFAPVGNPANLRGGGSSSTGPSSANSGGPNGTGGQISQGGSPSGSVSASCTAGASASSSPSASPSQSGSGSPSGSPTPTSPSPSPSPTGSSSGSGTPTPSDSPTSSPGSSQSAAGPSASAAPQGTPGLPAPKGLRKPSASPSQSCG